MHRLLAYRRGQYSFFSIELQGCFTAGCSQTFKMRLCNNARHPRGQTYTNVAVQLSMLACFMRLSMLIDVYENMN